MMGLCDLKHVISIRRTVSFVHDQILSQCPKNESVFYANSYVKFNCTNTLCLKKADRRNQPLVAQGWVHLDPPTALR